MWLKTGVLLRRLDLRSLSIKELGWTAGWRPTPGNTLETLLGPGGVDRLHGRIQIFRAGNVAGNVLPEGASTNLAGHQVRAVEPEAGGLLHQFGNAAFQFNAVHIGRGGLVRGQSAAALKPAEGQFGHGEVFHQRPHFGPVVEHHHHVASDQEGLPIGGIHGREVEEAVVHVRLPSLPGRNR